MGLTKVCEISVAGLSYPSRRSLPYCLAEVVYRDQEGTVPPRHQTMLRSSFALEQKIMETVQEWQFLVNGPLTTDPFILLLRAAPDTDKDDSI